MKLQPIVLNQTLSAQSFKRQSLMAAEASFDTWARRFNFYRRIVASNSRLETQLLSLSPFTQSVKIAECFALVSILWLML